MIRTALLFACLLLSFSTHVASAGGPESGSRGGDDVATSNGVVNGRRKELRHREGNKMTDQLGRFQILGDRVVFTLVNDPDNVSYKVLENLALERVFDHLRESPTERIWKISGVLTEYQKNNYLLLTRVAIQALQDDATLNATASGDPAAKK